jgi:predicted transposase/invertase (TIGR01784 family)
LKDIFSSYEQPIEDLTFWHPERKDAALQESIVDVVCQDITRTRFFVQIQCCRDNAFLKCPGCHISQAYIDQNVKDSSYSGLRPVRCLVILKETLFPRSDNYISRHEYLDVNSKNTGDFIFTFLELSKIEKTLEESSYRIEKWAYFFKHAPDTTDEELIRITRECPVIGDAYQVLDRSNYSTKEMDEYFRHAMKRDEIAVGLSNAKQEGLAEGRAEEKREMVLEMHRKGIDKHVIAEISNLSLEDLEKIIDRD